MIKRFGLFLGLVSLLVLVGCGANSDTDYEILADGQEVEDVEMEDSEEAAEIDVIDEVVEEFEEENLEESTEEIAEEATDEVTEETETVETTQEFPELTLEDLAECSFYFSSGAGGWGEIFEIEKDGSFQGNYHDSNMGDTGEGYPRGTQYYSDYVGKFSELTKINEYTYQMNLEEINYTVPVGTEEIKDEILYIYTESYFFRDTKTCKVFLDGAPTSDIEEYVRIWLHIPLAEEEVPYICIVDEENKKGAMEQEWLTLDMIRKNE